MYEISVPYRVDLELTHRCNQRCVHCMVNAGPPDSKDNEMSFEQIDLILKKMVQAGIFIIQFTGGEPTLRQDLSQILVSASRLRYFIFLSTNGSLINEELAKTVAQYNVNIEISLDGATPGIHDKIRGKPGAFRAFLQGTRCLSKVGCRFGISMVLLRQNIHQVKETIQLVADLGADQVSFKLPRLIGRAYNLRNELCPSFEQILQTRENLAILREKWDNIIKVVLPEWPVFNKIKNQSKVFGCAAATWKFGILADGTVVPCLLWQQPLGKLPMDSVFRVWNHPYMKQIRKVFQSDNIQCADCDYKEICGGGCRAAAIAAGNGLNGCDPFCLFYRQGDGEIGNKFSM